METKKSVMGPIISVFVLVLVVAILAGMAFLFTSNLQGSFKDTAPLSNSLLIKNESITATDAGTALSANTNRDCQLDYIFVQNQSGAYTFNSANYTVSGCKIANVTSDLHKGIELWNITYTYKYRPFSNAESSVNKTESSGYTVIGYLPLIFLAIIFGALLTLVLKIILPYLNLGKEMGGF